jgi:hypothetical protein
VNFFMVFIAFMGFMSWDSSATQTVAVRLDTPFGQIDLAIDTVRAPITAKIHEGYEANDAHEEKNAAQVSSG